MFRQVCTIEPRQGRHLVVSYIRQQLRGQRSLNGKKEVIVEPVLRMYLKLKSV